MDSNFAKIFLLLSLITLACSSCNVSSVSDQTPSTTSEAPGAKDQSLKITEFGALCDGSTDDSAAIQRAITAASAQGVGIDFTGMCAVGSKGIVISGDGVVLRGVVQGAGINILSRGPEFATFGATSIRFSKCSQCGIDGLRIEGNGVATNLVGFDQTINSGISNSILHGSGNWGAVVASGNVGNRYTQNEVSGGTGVSRGLWIGNTMQGTLEQNAFIADNTVSFMPATGIVCTCSNSTVIRNQSSHNLGSGIIFPAGLETASHVTVSQNVVAFNKFFGFQSDATPGSFSAFITLTDNISHDNATAGIYVVRAQNWLVNGNHVFDNLYHGIEIGEAKHIKIQDNVVEDTRNDSARTQDIGINVTACASLANEIQDVTLSGNTSRNNITNGVFVANCAQSTMSEINIAKNSSDGNGAYGIRAAATNLGAITSVSITGNILTGNRWPIRVDFIDGDISDNH